MKRIKDLKIGFRLNIILSTVFIIIFVAMGLYTINMQQNKIIEDTDIRMNEQVEDLSNYIEAEVQKSQQDAAKALDIAETMLSTVGGVKVGDTANGLENTQRADGNNWYINEENISRSHSFVDMVKRLSGADVSIFKRENNDFKRISTTVVRNGNREIGTTLMSGTQVAQTILSGQKFKGRAIVIDEWNITGYAPIMLNGRVEGIIGIGIKEKDLQGLRQIFKDKKYFATGYPYLIDKDGVFIIHPNYEGEDYSSAEFFQQMKNAGTNSGKTYYQWDGSQKYQYFQYIPSIESYVAVTIYEHELMGIINQVRNALIVAILLGIGFFVIVITQVSRSISKGLKKGVDFAEKIAEGDLTVELDVNQKDEVGQLAEAMKGMVENLRNIVSSITMGSENIASASHQISSGSQQLSQGATEQASSAEEVSSSMEEMASNIQQNTDNAQQTEKISLNASEGINKVSAASKESLSSIKNIADKIGIITEIARQTNILALNAAVEAARAGEHGKGFAVVAAEVRKLAERSQVAADEIVTLASSSVTVTEEAGKLMAEIMPEIEKTTKLVQEISAASIEQNSGADQVNNAIQQLNEVTQQNAAASEELATSAEELNSQADQLKEIVGFFKTNENSGKNIGVKKHAYKSSAAVDKGKLSNTTAKQHKKPQSGNKSDGFNLDLGKDDSKDSEFEKF